ncbi:hypothetical protein F4802DRAFT_562655 [Xylaria palmicola]|nr:hypothetical protein F4802DRAFT_562655 [Xylaria palmicola]
MTPEMTSLFFCSHWSPRLTSHNSFTVSCCAVLCCAGAGAGAGDRDGNSDGRWVPDEPVGWLIIFIIWLGSQLDFLSTRATRC